MVAETEEFPGLSEEEVEHLRGLTDEDCAALVKAIDYDKKFRLRVYHPHTGDTEAQASDERLYPYLSGSCPRPTE